MNRAEKRKNMKKMKKLNAKEFWSMQNVLHSKAYGLAQKHYEEAMDVVLQPKQKAAVVAKAHEIRELWDGIREVTTTETEADFFRSIGEDGASDDRTGSNRATE